MFSNPSLYIIHGHLQCNDSEDFCSSVLKKMDWTNEEDYTVMDIGCGLGNICRKILLPASPKVKKVIAFDIQQEMIEFARKHNAHEKIEYYVIDAENQYSMKTWSKHISKVISLYCFHWFNDIRRGFENVYQVLKPGGEAGILFILSTRFWDSYSELVRNPLWNKYLKNRNQGIPESHIKNQGSSHFRQMLREIGFNVIICEEQNIVHTYPDDDDARGFCSAVSILPKYIPEELKTEFIDDLFRGCIKYNGRSADGKPFFHYRNLTLLIQKPKM